jgi:hypothetical protein
MIFFLIANFLNTSRTVPNYTQLDYFKSDVSNSRIIHWRFLGLPTLFYG